MKSNWKLIVMLSVFVASFVLSAFPFSQSAQAKGIVSKITLTASAKYPSAKATAKYKVNGAQREFQVEVENVKALAGKTLSVFVDGKKAGSMVVNALGAGRLNLNTTRGQVVPMVNGGSKVVIKFGIYGVASGKFLP
jgi:hypothetical protein